MSTPTSMTSRSLDSKKLAVITGASRGLGRILAGFHDPVTSHLALLSAFLGVDGVHHAYAEAVHAGYLWHEFGDSHLVLRPEPEKH